MFLNDESHFAQAPNIDIQRSKMRIESGLRTAFNNGELVPIYCAEVLPGDTIKLTYGVVARLPALLTPVMDDLELYVHAFFVPNRLVCNRWKEIMMENTAGPWVQQTQYAVPTISAPSGGFPVSSLADYLEYPVNVNWSNTDINAPSVLPIRDYCLIWNEFYRDENLSYPLNIPMSDANQTGMNGTEAGYTDIDYIPNGAKLATVAKIHDYFTSALPSAQKAAAPVTFPLINGTDAPVFAKDKYTGNLGNMINNQKTQGVVNDKFNLIYVDSNAKYAHSGNDYTTLSPIFQDIPYGPDRTTVTMVPANLWADLSSSVGAVTVNELRLAFQLQRWYETSARSGSRYQETIKAFFGVSSPDSRLQRPEFLGGNKIPIQINQVVSSVETATDPLGSLAATSDTSDAHTLFEHSFTEHGYLMCLAFTRRARPSYSQGMPRHLLRKTYTDFYWPVFAHIGEQPIPKVCIYADGNMNSDSVFGYQEAWAEYRFKPSVNTSIMRAGVTGSLSSWHFGDLYRSAPVLSDSWIREGVDEVDRTLSVGSSVTKQIFTDFAFVGEYTRPMPVYSVPGLIDHF